MSLYLVALVLALSSSASDGCISFHVTSLPGDSQGTAADTQNATLPLREAPHPFIKEPAGTLGRIITLPGDLDGVASGHASLYSGKGSGTYYYDVKTHCPQDPHGYPETHGYTACESYTPGPHQQTLKQGNSNNVVAIDMNVLKQQRSKLCGKQINVFHNGNRVSAPDGGQFYVWDGCAACVGGGRIDFSVSGLRKVVSDACNVGVVPGVSWMVVDVQARKFYP